MSDTSCLDDPDQIDTPTIFIIKSNKLYIWPVAYRGSLKMMKCFNHCQLFVAPRDSE